MPRLAVILLPLALVAVLLSVMPASAKDETFTRNGLAVSGYDPVSYFDGTPRPGEAAHAFHWKGAEWRFASRANLERFRADPAAYAPQFGGYCAYGVSQGYAVKAEPDVWKIVAGRLYLNYDARVQRTWQKDIPGHITAADRNWPDVLR